MPLKATEASPETREETPLVCDVVRAAATTATLEVWHDQLARYWVLVDATCASSQDEAQRLRFATALIEIGGNIIRHGYMPDAAGTIELCLLAWPDRLEARYTDDGLPYSPAPDAAPVELDLDATDWEDLPEHGYGIQIARAALDVFAYQRTIDGHNQWTLISYLKP